MASISKNGINFTIEKITDNTDEVLLNAQKAINRALEIIGEKAETYTKAITPVDTGALRNSFTHRVDGDKKKVTIGSNIEYAPYVELGTGKLYDPPPEWIEFHAKKGRGLDRWYYKDEQGKWHVGYPRKGVHMLQNGIMNHLDEFKEIIKSELGR